VTDDEANVLLKALSDHFKEPVMPVTRYCDALRTWMTCIEKLNNEPADEFKTRWCQGSAYHMHLGHISTDIQKSNLLARLIYEGEKFRTERCPIHNGHLDMGVMFNATAPCPHGCDFVGWYHKKE
jgi:hypothetical protein